MDQHSPGSQLAVFNAENERCETDTVSLQWTSMYFIVLWNIYRSEIGSTRLFTFSSNKYVKVRRYEWKVTSASAYPITDSSTHSPNTCIDANRGAKRFYRISFLQFNFAHFYSIYCLANGDVITRFSLPLSPSLSLSSASLNGRGTKRTKKYIQIYSDFQCAPFMLMLRVCFCIQSAFIFASSLAARKPKYETASGAFHKCVYCKSSHCTDRVAPRSHVLKTRVLEHCRCQKRLSPLLFIVHLHKVCLHLAHINTGCRGGRQSFLNRVKAHQSQSHLVLSGARVRTHNARRAASS